MTILLLGLQKDIPANYFTRDVAVLSGGKFYFGAISTIGMFLWCASSAVCLFSSRLLSIARSGHEAKFLLFAGTISFLLMVDDQFMLHETVFPSYLGIHEYVVLSIYPVLIGAYLILYYKLILRTQFLILLSSLGFLGLSMVVDMIFNIPTFVEDGFKFFGIAGWFAYHTYSAFMLISPVYTRHRDNAMKESVAA